VSEYFEKSLKNGEKQHPLGDNFYLVKSYQQINAELCGL